jgi:mono/diheme cytochrome c family protein
MLRIISAAFMLAIFATAAPSQSCVRTRNNFLCHNTYAPAVVATTYTTPTYNYATPVIAIEVPTALDYYYSLGSYYQSQLIADAVVGKLALLNQTNRQTEPLRTQRPEDTSIAPRSLPPQVPGRDDATAALAKVVGDNCVRCHSASKAGGGLDLSNLSAIPELQRYKIAAFVNDGSMPKGGQPLPDEQAKLFFDWAKGFRTAQR